MPRRNATPTPDGEGSAASSSLPPLSHLSADVRPKRSPLGVFGAWIKFDDNEATSQVLRHESNRCRSKRRKPTRSTAPFAICRGDERGPDIQ